MDIPASRSRCMVPGPASISMFFPQVFKKTEQELREIDGTQVPEPSMVISMRLSPFKIPKGEIQQIISEGFSFGPIYVVFTRSAFTRSFIQSLSASLVFISTIGSISSNKNSALAMLLCPPAGPKRPKALAATFPASFLRLSLRNIITA